MHVKVNIEQRAIQFFCSPCYGVIRCEKSVFIRSLRGYSFVLFSRPFYAWITQRSLQRSLYYLFVTEPNIIHSRFDASLWLFSHIVVASSKFAICMRFVRKRHELYSVYVLWTCRQFTHCSQILLFLFVFFYCVRLCRDHWAFDILLVEHYCLFSIHQLIHSYHHHNICLWLPNRTPNITMTPQGFLNSYREMISICHFENCRRYQNV